MLRQLTRVSSLRNVPRMLTPTISNGSRVYSTSEEKESTEATAPPAGVRDIKVQSAASSISDSESSDGSSSDADRSNRRSNTTYVEEEVNKFRSMASLWWDVNGDAKPLHSLNRLRMSLIRDGIIQSGFVSPEELDGPMPLTGLKILDVGCGGGILCEPLARLGASVVGLDAAEENVAVARLHADRDPRVRNNVEYICSTVEEHAESLTNHYDAVVASEVLEHIEATDLFIKTCSDALKPGGSFFITTINKTAASWLGAIIIAEYALRLLPVGTHDWNKFVPRQELLFMLEKNGFVTRLVHGMAYNPVTNNWCWLAPTSINYAVHALKAS
ncbi:Hexaprenyldihydroxybenzoate methyltransferase, mitochondrial [Halocaridina rubra]|uniref:Ubiquinone biosynthesis O-methyltransferase, mitochondrial n=1 Tax=Halocaridina rubra TaxID=373956 RepID=A0AAN8ZZS7_HALRR